MSMFTSPRQSFCLLCAYEVQSITVLPVHPSLTWSRNMDWGMFQSGGRESKQETLPTPTFPRRLRRLDTFSKLCSGSMRLVHRKMCIKTVFLLFVQEPKSEGMASAAVYGDDNECHICKELFTDPRLLPCGHTVCLECIYNWRESILEEYRISDEYRILEDMEDSVPCPFCRQEFTTMPSRLPKNYSLLDNLGKIKESVSSGKRTSSRIRKFFPLRLNRGGSQRMYQRSKSNLTSVSFN